MKFKTDKAQLPLDFDATSSIFFCRGHLEDRPASERSADARYCHFCYDCLTKEARLLPPGRHPKWVPKDRSGASMGFP